MRIVIRQSLVFWGQPLYPEAPVVTNIIQSFVITPSVKLWSKQKLLLPIRPPFFLTTGIEIEFFSLKLFTQRGNQIHLNMWAEWKWESWWNNLMLLSFFPGVATWQTTIYNLQFAIHPTVHWWWQQTTTNTAVYHHHQHPNCQIKPQIIMNNIFMLL